jgi:hypothetical protein
MAVGLSAPTPFGGVPLVVMVHDGAGGRWSEETRRPWSPSPDIVRLTAACRNQTIGPAPHSYCQEHADPKVRDGVRAELDYVRAAHGRVQQLRNVRSVGHRAHWQPRVPPSCASTRSGNDRAAIAAGEPA